LISNHSVLAVIPARKGSKGLPGKNKKILIDMPLISWSIQEAKKSKYIDRLIVSTNDQEIIKIAKNLNCEVPFKRLNNLAKDNTEGIDVALDVIHRCPGFDILVYLQPTSPLRLCDDIDRCIEIMIENDAESSVSICEVDKSPYLMYQINNDDQMIPVILNKSKNTNRQKLPIYYSINGSVYVARIDWLKVSKTFINENTRSYVMPRSRSIDIDNELDFIIAETIALNTEL